VKFASQRKQDCGTGLRKNWKLGIERFVFLKLHYPTDLLSKSRCALGKFIWREQRKEAT
jgi:hypothetical protein